MIWHLAVVVLVAAVASGRTHKLEVHFNAEKLTMEFSDEDIAVGRSEVVAQAFVERHGMAAVENVVPALVASMTRTAKNSSPFAKQSALTRPVCLRGTTFANVLLVVMFTSPHFGSIPVLESLYRAAFPNIRLVSHGRRNSFHALRF